MMPAKQKKGEPIPWRIEQEAKNGTCIIICGGTSITPEMLERFRQVHAEGKAKVIVVNSAYVGARWADVLFFADARWWNREYNMYRNRLLSFAGRIATIARTVSHPRIHWLRRTRPYVAGEPKVGIDTRPDHVSMEYTSLQAALNIGYHFGSRRIIVAGADGREGANGRVHYHEEYPWRRMGNTWRVKVPQLKLAARDLEAHGVKVYNVSPISALSCWPKVSVAQALKGV